VKISSYSICRTLKQDNNEDVIKLDFLILADRCDHQLDNILDKFTLIFDLDFQFIDENWSIIIDSPLVIKTIN
jgi:hypothetical protein